MVVVLASAGYPETTPKARSFPPLRFPRWLPTHSCGHEARRERKCVTDGGRVLGAVGMGSSLKEAREERMECASQSIFLRNISAGTLDIVNFQRLIRFYLAFLQKEGEKNQTNGKEEQIKKKRKQEKLVVFIPPTSAGVQWPRSSSRKRLQNLARKENPRLLGRHIGHGW